MQKIKSFILFAFVLVLTSGSERKPEHFDDYWMEPEPPFGRIRTMEQLLDVLASERDRHIPQSLKDECAGNHYYGCSPRLGEYGLIAPCCSDVCCLSDAKDRFGTCRPKGPCLA